MLLARRYEADSSDAKMGNASSHTPNLPDLVDLSLKSLQIALTARIPEEKTSSPYQIRRSGVYKPCQGRGHSATRGSLRRRMTTGAAAPVATQIPPLGTSRSVPTFTSRRGTTTSRAAYLLGSSSLLLRLLDGSTQVACVNGVDNSTITGRNDQRLYRHSMIFQSIVPMSRLSGARYNP